MAKVEVKLNEGTGFPINYEIELIDVGGRSLIDVKALAPNVSCGGNWTEEEMIRCDNGGYHIHIREEIIQAIVKLWQSKRLQELKKNFPVIEPLVELERKDE